MAKPDVHKKGRPGDKPSSGGPKSPSFRREFEVGGKPDAVELTVKIVKGDRLAHGEKVWFWLGTETQKHQKPVEESDGVTKKLWELLTVSGYAQAKLDLSARIAEGYTHITAVHGNHGWEETRPLPVAVVMPSGTTGSSAKKTTRVKIAPEPKDGQIVSRTGAFSFSIHTFDAAGKKFEDGDVVIRTNTPTTIINAANSALVCDNRQYCQATIAGGMLTVNLEFPDGMECTLIVTHVDSGETITICLKLE